MNKQSLGNTVISTISEFRAAPPLVFSVKQFAARNPVFTEAALRNMVFKADERHASNGVIPGNGLIECGAIIRLGRKVLIDEPAFFNWIKTQSGAAK
jgi:hypothetical protein